MAGQRTRDIRPDFAVRGLFLTFGFVIAAFFPFLALYLDDKGLSGSGIGLVIAAMAVARILLNPIWGHLADATLGRRTSLQIGALLSACFGLVLAGVESARAIALAGFFLAGAMVSAGPNIDAITLEHLGAERMCEYGKMRSWESFTYAIGCLMMGCDLPDRRGSGGRCRSTRWRVSACSRGRSSSSETRRSTRRPEAASSARVGAVFREAPRFWGFLAAMFLVWTGFNAAWNFISLKIASEGGGPWLVGHRHRAGRAGRGPDDALVLASADAVRAATCLRPRLRDLRRGLPALGLDLQPDDRLVAHGVRRYGVQPALHHRRGRGRPPVAVVPVLVGELGRADGGLRPRTDPRRGHRRVRLRDAGPMVLYSGRRASRSSGAWSPGSPWRSRCSMPP